MITKSISDYTISISRIIKKAEDKYKKLLKNLLRFLNLAAFLFLIYHISLLAISNFNVDVFDGSLRLIAHQYTKLGEIPYRDFGVVYPPGYFIILGKIIAFNAIYLKGFVQSFLLIIYLIVIVNGIKSLSKNYSLSYPILFITVSIIIFIFNYGDPLSILYILVVTVLSLNYINTGRKNLLKILFVFSFTNVWFRWDWPITIITLYCIVLFVLTGLEKRKILTINKKSLRKFGHAILTTSMGAFSGFALMGFYLWNQGVLKNAIDFFVVIPTKVIGPYRRLPIPAFKIRPLINLLPYIALSLLFVISFLSLLELRKTKKNGLLSKIILLSTSFVLLPYALGRSGIFHFIPLWFLSICILAIYNQLYFKSKIVVLLLLLTTFPFFTIYKNNLKLLSPKFNRLDDGIKHTISNCFSKVEDINPSTIFLGRISYDKYLYNNVILYFTKPNASPASSYISDEPGLQSSCKYGGIISDQLNKAEKPMLAFLETGYQPAEMNMTATMKSCGMIEKFLKNNTYQFIDKCYVENFEFEIRVYE